MPKPVLVEENMSPENNHTNTDEVIGSNQETVTNGPRETMVSTAVHFLQNPQVRDSPMSQKRVFLLKKGLTNEEVDVAFDRSNQVIQKQHQPIQSYGHTSNALRDASPDHMVPSFWSRFNSIGSSVAIIGITCFGLYQIYKLYIKQMFAQSKQKEDRLSQMELQLVELNRSLSQLRRSLSAVETTVTAQKSQLSKLCDHKSSPNIELIPSPMMLNDIKSEIASIKSLLLNRSQFPAAPSISTIPSWQLSDSITKEKVKEDKPIEPMNEAEQEGKDNSASVGPDTSDAAYICTATTVSESAINDTVFPADMPEEKS